MCAQHKMSTYLQHWRQLLSVQTLQCPIPSLHKLVPTMNTYVIITFNSTDTYIIQTWGNFGGVKTGKFGEQKAILQFYQPIRINFTCNVGHVFIRLQIQLPIKIYVVGLSYIDMVLLKFQPIIRKPYLPDSTMEWQ